MSVETIGEALRAGWTVNVRCAQGNRDGLKSIRECLRSDRLDLASIVWTRGRAFPLAQLRDRLMCPSCGSRRVAVAFSPPAPGGTVEAALTPSPRDARVGDMNFTIEEWDGPKLVRILCGTPDLDVASAAFEGATKAIRKALKDWPGLSIEMKHGSRLMRRYPAKEAGGAGAAAASRPDVQPLQLHQGPGGDPRACAGDG